MARLVFDVETDGFLYDVPRVSRIWVIAIGNIDTGEIVSYGPDEESLSVALSRLSEAEYICGHNIYAYDLPLLEKMYGFTPSKEAVSFDTLVGARVAYPDIGKSDALRKGLPKKLNGSHKLEAWGYRLNMEKLMLPDEVWSSYAPVMHERCCSDVEITMKLREVILAKTERPQHPLPMSVLDMEMAVAQIIARQVNTGVWFDCKKAEALYLTLQAELDSLMKLCSVAFPGRYIDRGIFVPKRDNKQRGYHAGVACSRIEFKPFNPTSRMDIIYNLKRVYGWIPSEFTAKGQPKIDDEILEELPYPEVKPIARLFMIKKRLAQLAEGQDDNDWMHSQVADGRIHGAVNSNGCVTGRMSHSHPNLGQVPKAQDSVPYGAECRDLFGAEPGHDRCLVGIDAKGLELRCLGHYLTYYDNGAYANEVVHGDVHTRTLNTLKVKDRDMAKHWTYAWLYGAGDKKLGKLMGKGQMAGRTAKMLFYQANPSIAKLMATLKKACRRGYLLAMDGRPIPIRSDHAALNTLLQSAGALVMKRALVIFNQELENLRAQGYYAEIVLNVHDEWQVECDRAIAEQIGKLGCEAITRAGHELHFQCELEGDYKIGLTWKETH